MDSTKLLLSAALAGIMSAATAANAEDALAASPHVKCYGIATAGHNDCGNASGTHGCQGEAKVDNDPGEFKLVAAEAYCTTAGGQTTAPKVK